MAHIKAKCVYKARKNGKITDYYLIDKHGNIDKFTSNELKDAMAMGAYVVSNLKRTSDNRLIDIKDEFELPENVKYTIKYVLFSAAEILSTKSNGLKFIDLEPLIDPNRTAFPIFVKSTNEIFCTIGANYDGQNTTLSISFNCYNGQTSILKIEADIKTDEYIINRLGMVAKIGDIHNDCCEVMDYIANFIKATPSTVIDKSTINKLHTLNYSSVEIKSKLPVKRIAGFRVDRNIDKNGYIVSGFVDDVFIDKVTVKKVPTPTKNLERLIVNIIKNIEKKYGC